MALPLILTLELTGTEPLQGWLSGDATELREFVGWIGLATALGEIVEASVGLEPGGARLTSIDETGDGL
jgi:hypothetical protein